MIERAFKSSTAYDRFITEIFTIGNDMEGENRHTPEVRIKTWCYTVETVRSRGVGFQIVSGSESEDQTTLRNSSAVARGNTTFRDKQIKTLELESHFVRRHYQKVGNSAFGPLYLVKVVALFYR